MVSYGKFIGMANNMRIHICGRWIADSHQIVMYASSRKMVAALNIWPNGNLSNNAVKLHNIVFGPKKNEIKFQNSNNKNRTSCQLVIYISCIRNSDQKLPFDGENNRAKKKVTDKSPRTIVFMLMLMLMPCDDCDGWCWINFYVIDFICAWNEGKWNFWIKYYAMPHPTSGQIYLKRC